MAHTLLLVVHTLIAAILVGVILVQRSEGGGLGTGSTPSGLMSARGAANFLTRATAILATLFILTSIGLAFMAGIQRAPTTIDASMARTPEAPPPVTQLGSPQTNETSPAPAASPADAPADANPVPLAQ